MYIHVLGVTLVFGNLRGAPGAQRVCTYVDSTVY